MSSTVVCNHLNEDPEAWVVWRGLTGAAPQGTGFVNEYFYELGLERVHPGEHYVFYPDEPDELGITGGKFGVTAVKIETQDRDAFVTLSFGSVLSPDPTIEQLSNLGKEVRIKADTFGERVWALSPLMRSKPYPGPVVPNSGLCEHFNNFYSAFRDKDDCGKAIRKSLGAIWEKFMAEEPTLFELCRTAVAEFEDVEPAVSQYWDLDCSERAGAAGKQWIENNPDYFVKLENAQLLLNACWHGLLQRGATLRLLHA